MNGTQEKSLNIGYINLRAQTGFGLPKQIQVEQFLKSYKIDILHLQEAQIWEDTFEMWTKFYWTGPNLCDQSRF